MSVQQCIRCAKAGNGVRIKSFASAHPSVPKLKSMGLGEGCDICVERVSPFGDPCMILVKGYRLALRRKDFEAMELESCEMKGA